MFEAFPDRVELRGACLVGGPTVPDCALILMLRLEERGFTLARDGGALVVRPHDRLTGDDCQEIRRWKHHLLALLDAPRVA